ncbi:ATPase domain protein, partial [Vibrio parahaemolyticus V-223/04]|jgi:hypothetical protein
MKEL